MYRGPDLGFTPSLGSTTPPAASVLLTSLTQLSTPHTGHTSHNTTVPGGRCCGNSCPCGPLGSGNLFLPHPWTQVRSSLVVRAPPQKPAPLPPTGNNRDRIHTVPHTSAPPPSSTVPMALPSARSLPHNGVAHSTATLHLPAQVWVLPSLLGGQAGDLCSPGAGGLPAQDKPARYHPVSQLTGW